MSAYINQLNASMAVAAQARREDQERSAAAQARERLTPLEDRLARLLATIPPEVQGEGLALPTLQAALRGRWRGNCHPGELDRPTEVGLHAPAAMAGPGGVPSPVVSQKSPQLN